VKILRESILKLDVILEELAVDEGLRKYLETIGKQTQKREVIFYLEKSFLDNYCRLEENETEDDVFRKYIVNGNVGNEKMTLEEIKEDINLKMEMLEGVIDAMKSKFEEDVKDKVLSEKRNENEDEKMPKFVKNNFLEIKEAFDRCEAYYNQTKREVNIVINEDIEIEEKAKRYKEVKEEAEKNKLDKRAEEVRNMVYIDKQIDEKKITRTIGFEIDDYVEESEGARVANKVGFTSEINSNIVYTLEDDEEIKNEQ